MKTCNQISVLSRKSLQLAIALLVVLGSVLLVPGSTVQAASAEDLSIYSLATAYQHELHSLSVQQTNLDLAEGIATSVQNLITEAQAKSLDTSAISAALATFQSQLSSAESSHATADAILTTHAGFDDSGNVTNLAEAAQTVIEARQALADAHTILVQSTKDLFNALKTWEKANQILTQIDGLQVGYANEQAWLKGQQTNLGKADTVATNVQNLITTAQGEGLKVDSLSNALAAFQSKLTVAQAAHTSADTILTTHDGFDDSGNVTDTGAAKTTLKAAGQSLQAAHNALAQASDNMLNTLNKWKVKNHINSASPVFSAFSEARDSAKDLYNSVHVEDGAHIAILDTRLNNLLNALLNELS